MQEAAAGDAKSSSGQVVDPREREGTERSVQSRPVRIPALPLSAVPAKTRWHEQ